MVLVKSKKRSAETSHSSPHCKKRRVLAHTSQKSNISDDGLKDKNAPKKLAEVFSVNFRGINKSILPATLAKYFGKFGEVTRVHLPRVTSVAGKQEIEGSGSVTFSTKEAADAVLSQTHIVDEQKISVHASKPEKLTSRKKSNPALRLFVGNVPKEMGKKQLLQHFSQYGKIEHISLPTTVEDRSTHKGMAFIEFSDELEKKRAMAADQVEVEGNVIVLRISNIKEKVHLKDKLEDPRLFIGGIPKAVGKKALNKHFSQFGPVKHILLPTKTDDCSVHKGFAFVEFVDKLDREVALAARKHKFQVDGKVVSVRVSNRKCQVKENVSVRISEFSFEANEKVVSVRVSELSESAPKKAINKALQLFVGNIPKEVGQGELEEHFSQFGNIKSIALPTKPEDRSVHKGFAFIEFNDELAKEEALAADKHEFEANGKVVSLRVSEFSASAPKTAMNKALQLFVGNIPKEVGQGELEEHFSQFGNIKSIALPTKPEDRSVHKGFAFIEFNDELAKEEALAADKHELNVAGKITPLRVSNVKVTQNGEQTEMNKLPEEDQWVNNSLLACGLSSTTTAQTLSLHFGRYGKVKHVRMIRTQGKSNSAIVAFEDEEGVNAALEEDHEIDYSSVNVKKASLSSVSQNDHGSTDDLQDGEQEMSDEEDTDMEYDEESEEDDEEHESDEDFDEDAENSEENQESDE
ncbi:RNA recognition motif domain [Trinorchestia longiramus]|nr:RNA recognition motif domain [Trinorchestia longiramus]